MVRYLKRLKSSRLGRVQAFPMYGGLGMSAPSLHRDSLILCYQFSIGGYSVSKPVRLMASLCQELCLVSSERKTM